MSLKKNMAMFPAVAAAVLVSYHFLDKRIALFVRDVFWDRHSLLSSNIPDFLFSIVCLATLIGMTGYYYRRRKGIFNNDTRFFQLIAVIMPLAYALKSVLKHVFGRVDARFWVRYPGARDFHWFHGGGNYSAFPSGHMLVFTALLITIAQLYPRSSRVCYGLLAALALALIGTNYHYLSDVIAGAYLGLLVFSIVSVSLPLDPEAGTTSRQF